MICGKAACGMSYAVRRSGSAVAYCSLGIRCGTRNEKGFSNGIAHFTEHALFKGTAHRSASSINSYLDRLGGELNAFTTKEEIVLHSTVLKEDLRKAASLLMELASCPSFPAQEIEVERGVILEEIQSYKDSPSDDVYDRFEGMLFKGHPLSGPILGTSQSVRKITSDELTAFVARNFRPEAMVFSVVADFEEEKLEAMLLRLMDKWFPQGMLQAAQGPASMTQAVDPAKQGIAPERNCPIAGVKPPEGPDYYLPSPEKFDLSIEKKNHEANAVTGYLAPSLYEEHARVCAILTGNILAGPASNSLLNNILREKNGWVYGVESSYTQYSDTGIMAISLGCDRQNLDRCRKAMDRILRGMMETPMSEARLKAEKKQLLGQLSISSDNGESQCLSMGKSLLAFGKVASDNSVRSLIEEISAEDIRQMCCRIFGNPNLSTLVFL